MTNHLFNILTINPGSTSTKVALFSNNEKRVQQTIRHEPKSVQGTRLWDQFDRRLNAVQTFIADNHITLLDAVVGRGGLFKPVKRGTFKVNKTMVNDARRGVQGEHVSNLGCALAQSVAESFDCPAFVVDPVSVDEFEPVARLSGHPLIERTCLSHALNLGAAAHWTAEKMGIDISESRFIVAHLGSGISVAPLLNGRIIDVNDASNAGPFSPERTGSLPMQPFASLCFSGQYTFKDIKKLVNGQGGLMAYLNTNDLIVVEHKITDGDSNAKLVYDAMIYQIAKEIGAMATVLCGNVQAIVLTGGLAQSNTLVSALSERIAFIAPVHVYAGELEMEAMAAGAWRVLTGQEKMKIYR